jgi:hypothetical protein
MLIVKLPDPITRIVCLVCEKHEAQEAYYYQQVSAWTTDKTSLSDSNRVRLVPALAARRKHTRGILGGPSKHFDGKVFFFSCDLPSAAPRMSRNYIQGSVS